MALQRTRTGLNQQLSSIPVLSTSAKCPGGFTAVDSIIHWLSQGVRMPACIFQNGQAAAFIGKDGRLYTMRTADPAEDNSNSLHEVKSQDWQLSEGTDLAAVMVAHTERCLLVLDSKMELHVRQDDGTVQDECLGEEVVSSITGATLFEAPLPRPLSGHQVAMVACSDKHCLALTSEGVVHSCGSNSSGQLGLGHTDFNLKMAPVDLAKNGSHRFATFVACGSEHSAVLTEQGTAITFGSSHDFRLGRRSETWVNPWPVALEMPGSVRLVRLACGLKHTLFLSAAGELFGCGQNAQRQLSNAVSGCVSTTQLPFSDENGQPVEIYCHASLNVSVVLTKENRFFICGEAGSLFNSTGLIEQFLAYDRDAVIVENHIVCLKPSAGQVYVPGFNDPEVCGVELVAAKSQETTENDPEYAARLIQRHHGSDSFRRLSQKALEEGRLTPEDVILELGAGAGSSSAVTAIAENTEKLSVFVGLDTIKVRSKYLWRLLQSPCRGNVVRHEDGRFTVEIHKYSYEALEAYGRYLHEDEVFCRPEVAMELLEMAEEYVDSTGLAEHCAQLVRRTVCQNSLASCVASCLFLHRAALAVELTKLRLCVENCCDVLQVLESIDCMDLQAKYIRSIVMNFAAGNATAVVKSDRFNLLADALKSRLFVKLATMGLLKT